MKENKILRGALRYLIGIFLAIITIGNVIWITQNLPYQGNISTAEVRAISRIDIKGQEESLHIFNGQIECDQQNARAILCDHVLAETSLSVAINLQQNANQVIYDCYATYDGRQLQCQAFESVYTHGGLATPVVVFGSETAESISDFDSLASNYSMISFYNVQLWLRWVYQVLAILVLVQMVVWVWNRLGVATGGGRQRGIQIVGTIASIAPLGFVLFYVTLMILVVLNIVS